MRAISPEHDKCRPVIAAGETPTRERVFKPAGALQRAESLKEALTKPFQTLHIYSVDDLTSLWKEQLPWAAHNNSEGECGTISHRKRANRPYFNENERHT